MVFNNTTISSSNMAAAFTDISSTYPAFFLVVLAVVTAAIHRLNLLLPGYEKKQSKPGGGGVGGLALPPGPAPLPIIGCFPWLLVNKPAFRWIHTMMDKMNTKIACIRLGRVHVITVTCPQVGQEFLLRQDATFSSRPVHMSTEIPTYGYLTVALTPSGDQWKKMRRVVTSEVLSVQRHSSLQDKRMEEADHLTRWVYNMCRNEEGGSAIVKVRTVAQHYCGNVIRRLMLNKRSFGKGTVGGGPGPEEVEHVDSLFKILGFINAFSVSDYLPWLRQFDFDGHEDVLRTAMESVKKYNDPVIDHRIQMWRNGTNNHDQQAQDILDVLIQLTDPSTGAPLLTSSEIKAQILDLMLAAVDNPSHATEWALAEMINQPQILKKAVEELNRVVGNERLVEETDLPMLNYVKACAREAFRLHPVSAFNVPHVSTADAEVAGYLIPKGSHILISRISLGRNPNIWEEPLQFKPERHINHDGSQVVLADPKLGLLSFSTGRRGCPGVLLGSTMTTMLLARLLHGFSWTTPCKMSNKVNLTESNHDLSLSNPLLVLATPRLPNYVYPMP